MYVYIPVTFKAKIEIYVYIYIANERNAGIEIDIYTVYDNHLIEYHAYLEPQEL